MPTVVLGGSRADRPVVVPGRERVDLAALVALAGEAGIRLPFETGAVETALAEEDAADPADESRRAWFERLSPDTPSPDDEVALLLAAQARRLREAEPDEDRAPVRAAMAEALAVIASAETLLDVRLAVRGTGSVPTPARAWLGVRGEVAACLATVDGAELELAWGPVAALREMLAHLVRLPADAGGPAAEEPPARFTMPVELLAAAELPSARRREDLLPRLVERFPGAVTGADGETYAAAEALDLLRLVREGLTGRLRLVVLTPEGRAGLVTWLRLGSQWFALTPDRVAGVPVARAVAVAPTDLGAAVAPVLARVWGRDG